MVFSSKYILLWVYSAEQRWEQRQDKTPQHRRLPMSVGAGFPLSTFLLTNFYSFFPRYFSSQGVLRLWSTPELLLLGVEAAVWVSRASRVGVAAEVTVVMGLRIWGSLQVE